MTADPAAGEGATADPAAAGSGAANPPAGQRWRWLLRPWLLVSHLVVVGLATVFVSLGLWQLARHAEVSAANAEIAQRLTAAAVPLAEGLDGDPEWRRVVAQGAYEPEAEVLLGPRSRTGSAGFGVVTPLRLADGRVLLVDRGWVPLEFDEPPVTQAPPPAGDVTVTGYLRSTSHARRAVPEGGPYRLLSAVDPDLLGAQLPGPLIDAVYLVADAPAEGDSLPRPPDPPDTSSGPHLSYAIQWFAFALIAVVGYPLLLARRARQG